MTQPSVAVLQLFAMQVIQISFSDSIESLYAILTKPSNNFENVKPILISLLSLIQFPLFTKDKISPMIIMWEIFVLFVTREEHAFKIKCLPQSERVNGE